MRLQTTSFAAIPAPAVTLAGVARGGEDTTITFGWGRARHAPARVRGRVEASLTAAERRCKKIARWAEMAGGG
jgi:hypothetical protein